MSIVYLSGPISDPNPQVEYRNKLRFRFLSLKLLNKFKNIYNPAEMHEPNWKWEDYLAYDLLWIMKNRPVMYMMLGWETSAGARLERALAQQLGLLCLYEYNGGKHESTKSE